MPVQKLIDAQDPILHRPLRPFQFGGEIDANQLAVDLTETMLANNGMGLAANQIGVDARVFVIRANPVLAVFNPIIVDQSDQTVILEEGCLTYPGLIVKVKRPGIIRCRFTMPNGETVTHKFTGMTARVFLHEFDHLNGIVFFNRAHRYHREQAFKKWKR